ncbi:tetrahydrofolylpolyglutamate synthase [Diaporthe amygdali]|uniref:tetrahydrofolylpolyglutamate synthase n=1 Tax=Phomopsis amygdali TaxID=1214568 RepID=UPI0022FF3E1B|nr:tetrahydrofolylpolyglutamate synthase [Diaporthe amygdali]KAJ0122251.1 tetrahydrofolylpolyglutamate synthase [Diaporthe amygdali]
MSTTAAPTRTYEDAIDLLNTFQTPFAVIEARRKAGIRPDESSVREMRAYWARLGHSPEDLDRLNVVHVAGTKGKGSVCAFVASILGRHQHRQDGQDGQRRKLKVGLLTSPHLIAVRERIRIGDAPMSESAFARYFFEVSDALVSADGAAAAVQPGDAEPGSRPIYARYLTLMALHAFLREGVDVAVVETGVGGEYDATNIVARPVAAGVATLGIDHVFVLGDTVDKIAWHKAGIIKAGCPAFAVEQAAFPSTEDVLRARAAEKGVELQVVGVDPRLAATGVRVRPDVAFQKRNASLAIALAEAALLKIDPAGFKRDADRLPVEFKDGIEQVVWRGRCEVKEEGDRLRWHLDGAHTTDSLKMAARWFVGVTDGRRGPRVLIFNQQGRTEAIDFLEGLHSGAKRDDGLPFDHVVFCTNVTHATTGYKRDFVNHQYDPEAIQKLTVQRAFAERWSSIDPKAKITVIPSIEEAINVARGLTESLKEGETVQAFITGSLHLVGGALGILEGADAL